MFDLRAQKRKSRTALHQAMKVRALYIPPGTGTIPVPCEVRVHTKFEAKGDLKGTSFSYAEKESETPKIIFMEPGFELENKAVVSVEPGEAYRIDSFEPPDGITISASVVRLRSEQAAGLPVPEDG